MPSFSRRQSTAALQHIYDNVFCVPPESPLVSALNRESINNVTDLLSMGPDDVDALLYELNEGGSTTLRPLARGLRRLITVLQEFTDWRSAGGKPIGNDWASVTQEEFDEFRTSPALIGKIIGKPPFTRSTPHVTPSPSSSKSTDLVLQDWGVKHDPILFPTLKDEKYSDSQYRAMRPQACAQRVDKVLDPICAPSTNDEKLPFDRTQAYMYSNLEKVVLTEDTYGIQNAYKELCNNHCKSTKAALVSSDLLAYITGNRLGSDWKGTLSSYIVLWQEQVRLYESLVPSKNHFSDGQKRVMLQDAVNKVQELRQAQTTVEMQQTNTGKDLNFDQYCSLLVSAAQAYDNCQNTPTLHAGQTTFMTQPDKPDDNKWFTKKQATVETATYGSEIVAARTAVEKTIEIHLLLRYLGAPIRNQSYMFDDVNLVVNGTNKIHTKLHNRYSILLFRKAVAFSMLVSTSISGKDTLADILNKHWAYTDVWQRLDCPLLYKGETALAA